MLWDHHLDFHFHGALNHCIEIFDLEPQQCAVSVGSIIGIADSSVVMFYIKTMKLQHQLPVPNQPLVFPSAVITPAT